MKILLVVATVAEIEPLLAHFKLPSDTFVTTDTFDVLVAGVGMVATAFAMGQRLNQNYNLVINVGIAGSFTRGLALGEIVQIEKDTFAELGAEDHDEFISLEGLGLGKTAFESKYNAQTNLKVVNGITVNRVHGNNESIENTVDLYQPQTESMEGAAVFYACTALGIPALQVRTISNYVEPRNRANWKIDLAVKNLNKWLIKFLENYEQKMTNS